jgi:hypothetical protein
MTLKLFVGARRLLSKFWLNQPLHTLNQVINLDGSGNPRSLILPRGNVRNLNQMNSVLGDDNTIIACNPSENFLMHYNTYDYGETYPWRRVPLYYADALITGTIVSYFTGDPVANFNIEANGQAASTDVNGVFEVRVPFTTSNELTIVGVGKTGFEDYVKKVEIMYCDSSNLLDIFCSLLGPYQRFYGDAINADPAGSMPFVFLKESDPEFFPSIFIDSYDVGTLCVYEEHISGVITNSSTSDPIGSGIGGFVGVYGIQVTGAAPSDVHQTVGGIYRLNPFNPDYAPDNSNPISITATDIGDFPLYQDHVQADVEANYTGTREYDFEMDPL